MKVNNNGWGKPIPNCPSLFHTATKLKNGVKVNRCSSLEESNKIKGVLISGGRNKSE